MKMPEDYLAALRDMPDDVFIDNRKWLEQVIVNSNNFQPAAASKHWERGYN